MTLQKATRNSGNRKPRARSTQAKQEKRQNLLRSALELFPQYGYQGTSIEMITEKAGISVGTYYLYFKNKVEIYRVLNVEGAEVLKGLIEEAISWPGMTPLSQLSAVAGAYLRFYIDYRGYYDILSILHIGQKDFHQNQEMLEPLENRTVDLLKIVELILKKGIEIGELEEIDTWQATTALWGMMDGLILLDVKQNLEVFDASIQQLFRQGLEIVINGLRKNRSEGGKK